MDNTNQSEFIFGSKIMLTKQMASRLGLCVLAYVVLFSGLW